MRATITAKSGGTTVRDFVLWPRTSRWHGKAACDVDVTAPLVFAGYGIDAPEYGYSDYAGLDVAGKVVLVLSREPQATDAKSPFKGTWDTFHAYPAWKPEVARRLGAKGVLIVQGPPRRPQRKASGPTNGQIRTDRPNHSLTSPFWDLPVFNIDARVADELLSGSGKTIADAAGEHRQDRQAAIDTHCRRHRANAPCRQRTPHRADAERRRRCIEGSDPKLKDEVVIVTGHYDHTGQKAPFVFHGADDNATRLRRGHRDCRSAAREPDAAAPQRDVPRLRGRGGLPPGGVPLRRSPDRAARSHRRGAEHGHDRARRRLGDLEYPAEDNRNGVNVVGSLYSPDLRRVIEAQNRGSGCSLDYKTDKDDRETWFTRSDHYPFAITRRPNGAVQHR